MSATPICPPSAAHAQTCIPNRLNLARTCSADAMVLGTDMLIIENYITLVVDLAETYFILWRLLMKFD